MASHSRTVLVVEREAALRAVVAQALATDGYRVLATSNGKDALRMAAWHDDEVALVVTDMIVPGFDEGQLPELLSLDSPQIKVLYLDSGSASRTDTKRHLHALAWDAKIIPLHEQGWAQALVSAARDALRTVDDESDHARLDRVRIARNLSGSSTRRDWPESNGFNSTGGRQSQAVPRQLR